MIDIAGDLGYPLTGAERQRVLENGTKSLTAFLAFSRGLEAEERGDFAAAARWYGEAVDADPGFTAAREKRRTVTAMRVVAGSAAGDITTVGDAVASAIDALTGPGTLRGTALTSSVVDVAGTQGERATGGGSQPRIDDVNRPDEPALPHIVAIIRIVVTIPIGGGA